MSRAAPLAALVTLGALGCGSAGSANVLVVGSGEPDAGAGGVFQGADATVAPGKLGVSIKASATSLCAGQCVTLSPQAAGGIPPISFQWNGGDGGIVDTGAIQVCPTATTTYGLKATDSAASTGELTHPNDTGEATVTLDVGSACADAGPRVIDDGCESLADSFVAGDSGANPVPPWSYGWAPSLGGAFTLYPTYYPVTAATGPFQGPGWPAVAQWFDPANGEATSANGWSVPPIPDIAFNPSSMPSQPTQYNFAGNGWIQPPRQIEMSPGTAHQYAVARWTASRAGTYGVIATFTGLCGNNGAKNATTDLHVQHNGASLPSSSGFLNEQGAGNSFSFLADVNIAAGDTVDFVVGDGGDQYLFDMTGVDAKVCAGEPDGG